jgi:UDP-N-acetyl-D-glucosamine dehydrogenase
MRLTSSNHRPIVELAPNPLAELTSPAHAPQQESSAEPERSALPALSRVRLRTLRIGVVGLGYVGLPLAVAAAKSGFKVDGVDTDLNKIEKIMSGNSGISGFESELLNKVIESNLYFCSSDFSRISLSEIAIFCVPNPLDYTDKPDLSILLDDINKVGKNLKKGTLVIIESTIAPGTTSEILEPLLLKGAGLESGDLDIAYSPERIDPMNSDWDVTNTPKLVAGLTLSSLKRATDFYSKFIKEVIPVKSVKIAETAKLLENSFRLVNISFINELAVFCNKYLTWKWSRSIATPSAKGQSRPNNWRLTRRRGVLRVSICGL